jgi:hypothetical protein
MKKFVGLVNVCFLSILPILYSVSYLILGEKRGPFYWIANQDPDYAYLGNSLKLALFTAPSHTDHPGTPLQMFGAVLIRGWHSLHSILTPNATDLSIDVLSHPEMYLWVIQTALVTLTAFALFLLGLGTFRLCKSLPLAILIQSSPFLMIGAHLVSEPSRVSPDVLVFCLSQFLALLLVYYLYQENSGSSGKWWLSLGIIFGLGMAIKVTFLPIIWFFWLIKGIRRKVMALLVAMTTFVIATAPIISQYPRMVGWFADLATHTGPYKSGEQGLFSPAKIGKNLGILLSSTQIFMGLVCLATIVSVGVFLWLRFKGEPFKSAQKILLQRSSSLLLLTTLVCWTQILMTLTERPRSRYLDPSLGLVGFMLFALVTCLTLLTTQWVTEKTGVGKGRITQIGGAIALSLCWVIGIQQVNLAVKSIDEFATVRRNDLAQIETLYNSDQYRTCLKVNSSRTSSIQASLHFMNFWSGKSFSSELDKLYPGMIIYDTESHKFRSYSQPIPPPKADNKNCILVQRLVIPKAKRNDIQNQTLKDVYVGKVESLYQFKY